MYVSILIQIIYENMPKKYQPLERGSKHLDWEEDTFQGMSCCLTLFNHMQILIFQFKKNTIETFQDNMAPT